MIAPWHFRKIPAVQYCSLSPRTIVIKSADKTLAVPQFHVLTIQKLPRFLDQEIMHALKQINMPPPRRN